MKNKVLYNRVWYLFKSDEYKIENTYIFDWESDYFSLTKSGYSREVEIKVSKSDYKADFKKKKHIYLLSCYNKEGYFYKGKFRGWKNKHQEIKWFVENIPNRFYFAMPKNMIDIDEIPSYAGLIYVDGWKTKVIKKAPLLHRNKFDECRLLSRYRNKYYKYRNKL